MTCSYYGTFVEGGGTWKEVSDQLTSNLLQKKLAENITSRPRKTFWSGLITKISFLKTEEE
jgi:hypothetical protein